jgi:hypothetical protein
VPLSKEKEEDLGCHPYSMNLKAEIDFSYSRSPGFNSWCVRGRSPLMAMVLVKYIAAG